MFDLGGVTAIVTGGSSGIGLGMARGLAAAGADVAIWARDVARIDAAVAELEPLGSGRMAGVRCDVTEESEVVAAVAQTVEALGRIDVCIANAGGGHAVPFLELDLAEWDRMVRLDLTSVFLTFREAARHMVASGGGGRLVATSSIGTIFGMPRQIPYSAGKAGVEAMCRSLAVELARHDIQVNAVQPGWIETPLTMPLTHWEEFDRTIKHRTPARRWGEPDDLAAVAVYLASPASRFHTGDTIRLDGGYSVF